MPLADPDVPSTAIFDLIEKGISTYSPDEKKATLKKVNGIFELHVKKGSKEAVYTIDFKKEGTVYTGPAKPKADVVLTLADEVFQGLADGKINGQKAFMGGKLKVKGNIMLATKLDNVLQGAKSRV